MSLIDLLPLIVVLAGFYFLVKLRFFFILHPIKTFKRIIRTLDSRSSRRALALALGGTLGVGNIVGIAYGIMKSGGGCIFWVLVSGLFSSVIKYAESSISADFKENGRGGMMYVVRACFSRGGRFLSLAYSSLCLFLSLTMGAAMQSQSAVSFAEKTLSINPFVFSFFFTAVVLISIVRGAKKIEKITCYIIPLATIVYILLCFVVIFRNFSDFFGIVIGILKSAFEFKSAAYGALVFLSSESLREGFARGLLSNEAGAGTSAMAESRSESREACDVGLLGASEVFFDTTLLCTLTGLAILSSGVSLDSLPSAISLIISAFSSALGVGSTVIMFLLICAFSYSTVICWYYYGSVCCAFLFKKRFERLYIFFFLAFVLFGFLISESAMIALSDYLLFFMTVITLSVLIKKSERIVLLSENLKEF
jgi:AGCS family alanine or glycine:cation symporter